MDIAKPIPSPGVLHTQLYATTSNNDKRLIILRLDVPGSSRPLFALLDSGATNNFFRAESMSVFKSRIKIQEGPGSITVKLADGVPKRMPRRTVALNYSFDEFVGVDEFLVISLSGSFDMIFGMPWLSRHRPDIDWLNVRCVQEILT